MNPQLSDFPSTAILRRRVSILIVAAVIGLLGGVAYVVFVPPKLTSTTLVLLPAPADTEDSSSGVDTQILIAKSTTVLDRVGNAQAPPLSAREMDKLVDVEASTSQILQVQASSTDGAQAERLSQGVADAYVAFVSDTAREVSVAALADLNARRDRLRAQIANLQTEINATVQRARAVDSNSADGRKEAQILAGLRTQQANLALQLDRVEDRIATGAGDTAGLATSVIQPATTAVGQPLSTRLLVSGPIGAVSLVLLCAAVMLIFAYSDRRLRSRDDIADAIGSPVLASVRSRPQRSAAGWLRLMETYDATSVEAWAWRQLLRRLALEGPGEARRTGRVDHPRVVNVISLSEDLKGLAVGPQLAAFASSVGVSTRVQTSEQDGGAVALWAACNPPDPTQLRSRLHWSGMDDDDDDADPGDLWIGDVAEGRVALTIVLTVLDHKNPQIEELPEGAALILALAPGAAAEQDLARVGLAADQLKRRFDGVVVADPDRTDRTSGRSTSVQRSAQESLPVRLTGVVPDGPRSGGRQTVRG